MQKISPNLWFDTQAEDAATFYTSVFSNSKIGEITHYTKAGFEVHGQPAGKVMTVEFEVEGFKFVGLNGGPIFKINPSISFLVACSSKEEVDKLWGALRDGGSPLMDLAEYPFSPWYGWLNDKFSVSWQIMHMGDRQVKQKVTPTLMFVGDVCGRTEEAINYYTSIFHNANVDHIMRYNAGEEPDKEGTVRHAGFMLEGEQFAAMDSAHNHKFAFNEAVSLIVNCETQEEIDYYWEKLSEGGDESAQVCGWLKDKFGVSWQIVPSKMGQYLNDPDKAKVERFTNAFLKMKKFDISELEKAFEGK